MNEVKFVSPFKKLCITIGNLPTAYIESMSYYEGLTYLVNYIANNVTPTLNNNSEVVKELQEYVSSYFDNLDVTEEINNKLDEMADDGTLAQIINVEMIGTLSNLTTTDKSDLVSAINEVNANVDEVDDKVNLLNLTVFSGYNLATSSDIVVSNDNITYNGSIIIAKNSDGSIFKIYGSWSYTNTSDSVQSGSITLKNTGINPTSSFNISPCGIINVRNSATNDSYPLAITIDSNGDVIITERGMVTQTRDVIMFPCLYFAKNFGD